MNSMLVGDMVYLDEDDGVCRRGMLERLSLSDFIWHDSRQGTYYDGSRHPSNSASHQLRWAQPNQLDNVACMAEQLLAEGSLR